MKNTSPDASILPGIRLDIWLWAARFFKTRSLAKQAIEGGRISVDGATVAKASKLVHVGDVLVVQRGEERFELRVLGLDSARGPASVAQALYAETDDGRARREAEVVRRRDERAGYRPPESRPNKKARRLIRALGDIDAM
jgi:ribosome-associated heat shock protein Hsp15